MIGIKIELWAWLSHESSVGNIENYKIRNYVNSERNLPRDAKLILDILTPVWKSIKYWWSARSFINSWFALKTILVSKFEIFRMFASRDLFGEPFLWLRSNIIFLPNIISLTNISCRSKDSLSWIGKNHVQVRNSKISDDVTINYILYVSFANEASKHAYQLNQVKLSTMNLFRSLIMWCHHCVIKWLRNHFQCIPTNLSFEATLPL